MNVGFPKRLLNFIIISFMCTLVLTIPVTSANTVNFQGSTSPSAKVIKIIKDLLSQFSDLIKKGGWKIACKELGEKKDNHNKNNPNPKKHTDAWYMKIAVEKLFKDYCVHGSHQKNPRLVPGLRDVLNRFLSVRALFPETVWYSNFDKSGYPQISSSLGATTFIGMYPYLLGHGLTTGSNIEGENALVFVLVAGTLACVAGILYFGGAAIVAAPSTFSLSSLFASSGAAPAYSTAFTKLAATGVGGVVVISSVYGNIEDAQEIYDKFKQNPSQQTSLHFPSETDTCGDVTPSYTKSITESELQTDYTGNSEEEVFTKIYTKATQDPEGPKGHEKYGNYKAIYVVGIPDDMGQQQMIVSATPIDKDGTPVEQLFLNPKDRVTAMPRKLANDVVVTVTWPDWETCLIGSANPTLVEIMVVKPEGIHTAVVGCDFLKMPVTITQNNEYGYTGIEIESLSGYGKEGKCGKVGGTKDAPMCGGDCPDPLKPVCKAVNKACVCVPKTGMPAIPPTEPPVTGAPAGAQGSE